MSALAAFTRAVELAWEQHEAVPAGLRAWRETGNPILAARAYAAATAGALDDEAAAELEAGLVRCLGWAEQGIVALEYVSRTAGQFGYRLLGAKLALRRWTRQAASPTAPQEAP